MRIIAGSAKGRRLSAPKNLRIRPTADRVKESLFNIITVLVGSLQGSRVLDIFAGTGNLGIEALSRGAGSAVFIDNHQESVALIIKNLTLTGFEKAGKVVRKDVIPALQSLCRENSPYQLIFLDPPYQRGLTSLVLDFLADSSLVDQNTIVVAEYSAHEGLSKAFRQLVEFDRRVYGDTVVSLFRSDREVEESIPATGGI